MTDDPLELIRGIANRHIMASLRREATRLSAQAAMLIDDGWALERIIIIDDGRNKYVHVIDDLAKFRKQGIVT